MAVDGNSFVRTISAALAGAMAESDGSHVELCPADRLETKLAGWTNAEETARRAATTTKKRGDRRIIVLGRGAIKAGALDGKNGRIEMKQRQRQ